MIQRKFEADGKGRMGLGLTPYHLLDLIDGPGYFELSKGGYRHVRFFSRGQDYEITITEGDHYGLVLNGVSFKILDMPDDLGRWVPDEGEVVEFEIPPSRIPKKTVSRDGKTWLDVWDGD